jgi:diguanylate cyclase (GGDEF)-like protein/PAS domain S-box-containing protein
VAENSFSNLPDAFYRQLLNSLDDGIYFVDGKRQIVFWNRGAENISGYSFEEVQGRFCGDGILQHVDFDGNIMCGAGCPLTATIKDGENHEVDVYLKHRDGHRVPVKVISSPVYDADGKIVGAVERFTDITPQLADRTRINRLSQEVNTDPLTGIANRRFMELTLHNHLHRFKSYDEKFGVMFIDMDGLKSINDEFGHVAGDCAIKIVSRTLDATFRSEDVVGRWGGDEFLVILKRVDLHVLERIKQKVKRIILGTTLPADCGGRKVSVSIGLAQVQEDDSPESLVARADSNMYEDKRREK